MSAKHLSVVIPAYNEEERLPRTLARLNAYLEARRFPYEIVVVDDGSSDGTAERARVAGGSHVTVLRHEPNRGKGYAARRGMLAAGGALRLMTDADLSTPIEELARLEASLADGHDLAIGSRGGAGANSGIHAPWDREAMGRVFNLLARLRARPGLHDTQSGFNRFTWSAPGAAS